MERLKTTAISLLITIMTFEFGPLVLSALLYYAYTYCEDRPEKKMNLKLCQVYICAFVALPFIVFYLSKCFGIQEEFFETMKFIFNLKLIELYDFDYGVEDSENIDNLIMFSIAHLFSIFGVFVFSIYIVEHWSEKYMGLPFYGPDEKITPFKKVFGSVFFFFVLLGLIAVYYFSFSNTDIAESKFYKESILNIVFFPLYIVMNIVYITVVRVKPLPSSN